MNRTFFSRDRQTVTGAEHDVEQEIVDLVGMFRKDGLIVSAQFVCFFIMILEYQI